MKNIGLQVLLLLGITICSGNYIKSGSYTFSDDSVESIAIKNYLSSAGESKILNFPNLAKSLYNSNKFKYIWLSTSDKPQMGEAMMMLDCVVQYGLTPETYHPQELSYNSLKLITEDTVAIHSLPLKVSTDVLLTDAILTFIFHLHFGKLNPELSIKDVDNEDFKGFRIDSVLKSALNSKDTFTEIILGVQPRSKEYKALQNYLKLITEQYSGDCYKISKDTARLIALNLERYRWYHTENPVYIDINVPSFTLKYINRDIEKKFKVIVGKSSNPTPGLISKIRFFNTAPDWSVPAKIFRNELLPKILSDPKYLEENNFAIYNKNGKVINATDADLKAVQKDASNYYARQSAGCDNALGQIVFNFENRYSIYLHDTPDRTLFNRTNRALSHGCIRVENPKKLVALLLHEDGAPVGTYSTVINSMDGYRKFRYDMKKPVPIVIRYVTCELKDGSLIKFPDLYNRDKLLAGSLFNSNNFLSPTSY